MGTIGRATFVKFLTFTHLYTHHGLWVGGTRILVYTYLTDERLLHDGNWQRFTYRIERSSVVGSMILVMSFWVILASKRRIYHRIQDRIKNQQVFIFPCLRMKKSAGLARKQPWAMLQLS